MLNLPDAKTELEEKFNNASRALIEMTEELEKMKVKYGTGSQFVQRKEFLLNCLLDMQEAAVNEINNLRQAYKLVVINSKAIEMASDALVESLAAGIHTDYLFLLKPHGENNG